MRIEGTYKTPTMGMSTLSASNRTTGTAALQDNFRSDKVEKLTRRPPLEFDKLHYISTSLNDGWHNYYRKGNEVLIKAASDGIVQAFVDGEQKTVNGDISAYVANGTTDLTNTVLKFTTVADTTYVVDTTVKARMLKPLEEPVLDTKLGVSYINVTEALNYSENIGWRVRSEYNTAAAGTVTIPDFNASPSPETADTARATNAVATSLAASINAAGTTLQAESNGSTVAVWDTYLGGGFDPVLEPGTTWVNIVLSGAGGDRATIAINNTVDTLEGLPKNAVNGSIIKVQPDPQTEKGVYYLKATSQIEDKAIETDPTLWELEEVVWTETRSPDEVHYFSQDTMPYKIEYDRDNDEFNVLEGGWEDRRVGDEDTVPKPNFVDTTINGIGYFQKRLVFLSNNTVSMTRADKPEDWWRNSATSLLVTDSVSIESSATGIDELKTIIPHNKDLLISASNGHFKINGNIAITPQTVSMTLTSSFEIQDSVQPVSMDNNIYFIAPIGRFTGIQEYTGQENTSQDMATPITDEIIGLFDNDCWRITSDSNTGILALLLNDGTRNVIYIGERQETDEGHMFAWSKWTTSVQSIMHMYFSRGILHVVARDDADTLFLKLHIYESELNTQRVFLDLLQKVESPDGITIPIEPIYLTSPVYIAGEGCDYPFEELTLPLTESISGGQPCSIYVGHRYMSRYIPTRPFRVDGDLNKITTDRIRIQRYRITIENTQEINFRIDSEYSDFEDQNFNSRIMRSNSNLVGEYVPYSGNIEFSYNQNAHLAKAEFYTDAVTDATITDISWAGQLYKTSGRL